MPRLNKHQSKTEATRRNLLRAAEKVFARDGFEASRIEDIAGEIGSTRGAFYAHFRTKEDLFLALLEERAREIADKLRALLETADSRQARLALLRRHYVGRLGDTQWMLLILEWKLFVLRHPERRAQLAAAHRRVRRSLQWQVRDLLEGSLREASKPKTTQTVILESLLSGLVLERAYDPTRISKSEAAGVLERIFDSVVG